MLKHWLYKIKYISIGYLTIRFHFKWAPIIKKYCFYGNKNNLTIRLYPFEIYYYKN